jgi:hypothetical protein
MPLTAKFIPQSLTLPPSEETTLTLQVHNDDAIQQLVQLQVAGDLADHVVLASELLTLEPGETFDLPAVITPGAALAVGMHSPTVELSSGSGNTTATASVEVMPYADHAVSLVPESSKGSAAGMHIVEVCNLGNMPVTVGFHPDGLGSEISLDIEPATTVEPGEKTEVSLRVTPVARYWNGPSRPHDFVVRTNGSDGRSFELPGTYEQRPRIPAWLGPAALGALMALILWAIIWFAWIKPWVQDTADDAAAEAIEEDRIALEERIEEMEAAAAEVEELPLGTPIDFRLSVSPAGGNSASDSETVDRNSVLSITDIVLQNPDGSVGKVTVLRNDDILLQSELANFRDLDLHFVAPFVFEEGDDITLLVDCRTPAPGSTECPVGASFLGFIDEAN